METKPKLITFNGMSYDGPLLAYVLQNAALVKNGLLALYQVRKFSDLLIRQENVEINYKKLIDVTKFMHYDNESKRTSLKWAMFNRRARSIVEMDNLYDITEENIPKLKAYCYNDTYETKLLTQDLMSEIQYRIGVSKKYGLKCINWSSTKIGSEIMLLKYCRKKNLDPKALRKQRTYYKSIEVSRLISPMIKFKNPVFKNTLEQFKTLVLTGNEKTDGKKRLIESVTINDTTYDFSIGGLHACTKPGIFKSDDNKTVLSFDVKSYYPTLGIEQGWYPRHLDKSFVDCWREIRDDRFEAIAKGDTIAAESLKLSLNSVFGCSKSHFYPYKDDVLFYSITINGQLFLTMLAERLQEETGAQILMLNTDGIEVLVDNEFLGKADEIMKRWSAFTSFPLKADKYKAIYLRDVNNYLAVSEKGDVKVKGCFKIDKALHENGSKRIVPIALWRYFVYGDSPEKTIDNHLQGVEYPEFKSYGIFDFCIGARAKKSSSGSHFENYSYHIHGDDIKKTLLQKTIRFFVSEGGVQIYKETDKKKSAICSNYLVTLFNEYFDGPYRIKKKYYLEEINKIISVIESRQKTLF